MLEPPGTSAEGRRDGVPQEAASGTVTTRA